MPFLEELPSGWLPTSGIHCKAGLRSDVGHESRHDTWSSRHSSQSEVIRGFRWPAAQDRTARSGWPE